MLSAGASYRTASLFPQTVDRVGLSGSCDGQWWLLRVLNILRGKERINLDAQILFKAVLFLDNCSITVPQFFWERPLNRVIVRLTSPLANADATVMKCIASG